MTIRNQHDIEAALLLIASTRAALKNGVLHYSKEGVPLTTENEILTALQQDGEIVFDTNFRNQVTTDEEEFQKVKEEFDLRMKGFWLQHKCQQSLPPISLSKLVKTERDDRAGRCS